MPMSRLVTEIPVLCLLSQDSLALNKEHCTDLDQGSHCSFVTFSLLGNGKVYLEGESLEMTVATKNSL